MVEHRLAKARVEGSNPFSRSIEIVFTFTLIRRTSILLDALTICTKGDLLPDPATVSRASSGREDGLQRVTVLLWWGGFDRIEIDNRDR